MITFKIDGITCGHCKAAVERAVRSVEPGAEVAVDLGEGTVVVTGGGDLRRLAEAIRSEGYAVTGVAA